MQTADERRNAERQMRTLEAARGPAREGESKAMNDARIRKQDIRSGERYLATVTGRQVTVCIISAHSRGGWWAENEQTGRTVRIKAGAHLTELADA